MYLQMCHLYILCFCQRTKAQEYFWTINHDLSPHITVGRWTVAHNLKGENPSLFFWSKWICHKWSVMPEYTAQRVPSDLSRCRASYLSFHLIIPIHFSGLTCICCIWNKTYEYEFLCCWFYYIGGEIRRPSFLDGTMSKFSLLLLGIGVIFALIIILLAVIDEYLNDHDSWSQICVLPNVSLPFPID